MEKEDEGRRSATRFLRLGKARQKTSEREQTCEQAVGKALTDFIQGKTPEQTGPHTGAIDVADRIEPDPREFVSRR